MRSHSDETPSQFNSTSSERRETPALIYFLCVKTKPVGAPSKKKSRRLSRADPPRAMLQSRGACLIQSPYPLRRKPIDPTVERSPRPA